MIEKINMYNYTRQSGKTSNLKLKAITASRMLYDVVLIITHNRDMSDVIRVWFNDLKYADTITYKCHNHIKVVCANEVIDYIRGREFNSVLVLMDEPFKVELDKQIEMMDLFETSRTCYHIVGFGTDRTPKLFKDYIVNNDKLISF